MKAITDNAGNTLYEVEDEVKSLSGKDDLHLQGAVLRGRDMEGFLTFDTTFRNADLSSADLYWACIYNSDFSHADLSNANLQGATLNGSILIGAKLTNANLGRDNLGGSTELRGCDFSGADLEGANFEGAIWDRATSFPEGFDPKGRGMLFDDESEGTPATSGANEIEGP